MLDDKINRLQEIVDKIDAGVTVEEGIKLFETGVKLTRECLEYLKTQKGKITEIKEELDRLTEQPLESDE